MYQADGIRYSEKSITNQRILKAFAARELRCNMTTFVEYVLDTGTLDNAPPFTFEDIRLGADSVTCPHCRGDIPDEPIYMSELCLAPELNEDPGCDPREKYLCPVCGTAYGNFDDAKECCDSTTVYQCPHCQNVMTAIEYEELQEPGDMPREWWAVSPWLVKKLKERGAIVLEEHNLWGRFELSSTDPVESDDLMVDICRELEILDGQKNSWSKHVQIA